MKILLVRSNYYKEVVKNLTLGAVMEVLNYYLPTYLEKDAKGAKYLTKNDIQQFVLALNKLYDNDENKSKSERLYDKNIVDFIEQFSLENRKNRCDITYTLEKALENAKWILPRIDNFYLCNFHISCITTHGCLEIPQIIAKCIAKCKDDFDIIVALGCVIRGETTHYETVCNETNRAIMDISLTSKAIITNGIINTENKHQADMRAGFWLKDHQDKGGGAMRAGLKTFEEMKKLKTN